MKELYKTLEMLLQNTSDEKAKNDLSQIFGNLVENYFFIFLFFYFLFFYFSIKTNNLPCKSVNPNLRTTTL